MIAMERRGVLSCAISLAALLAAPSALAGPNAANSETTTIGNPPLLEIGRTVYNFRCYYCHGYSGDAKTLAASFLTPKPVSFVERSEQSLPLRQIEETVRAGRAGTAMKAFGNVIPESEIRAVAYFVFDEFVRRKSGNTRYHTAENGWPKHEKYRAANPFALGEVSLTARPETLSAALRAGRNLFLSSCISCHDRGKADGKALEWASRPLSYPRNNYDHRRPEVDAATSATPYHLHDSPPKLNHAGPSASAGERLFQQNCAFCHAADGTGKGWIGSFMDPPARNLTDSAIMGTMTRARLAKTIRDGIPGTSMPAWKSVLTPEQIDAIVAYVDAAFHRLADSDDRPNKVTPRPK